MRVAGVQLRSAQACVPVRPGDVRRKRFITYHPDCVGTAYTEIRGDITSESELIRYIREKRGTNYGGEYYQGTVKGKIGVFNHVLVEGFWFYNHAASLYRHHKRKTALSLLNH